MRPPCPMSQAFASSQVFARASSGICALKQNTDGENSDVLVREANGGKARKSVVCC